MGYKVKEIRDNVGISKDHSSFSTFDVLTELDGNSKWISVPHELYFPWALMDSKKLQEYMDKKDFKNWEEAIKDLTELDYDWTAQMTRYIERNYAKRQFPALPYFNPDKEDGDHEDEDE